jgi:hypothetical protein
LYKRLNKSPDQLRTQSSFFSSPSVASSVATTNGRKENADRMDRMTMSPFSRSVVGESSMEEDEDNRMLAEALAMSVNKNEENKKDKEKQEKQEKQEQEQEQDDSESDDDMAMALAMSMSQAPASTSSTSSTSSTVTDAPVAPSVPMVLPTTPSATFSSTPSTLLSPSTIQRKKNSDALFISSMKYHQRNQTRLFMAELRKRQSSAWIASCRDLTKTHSDNALLPSEFWKTVSTPILHLRALGFCGIDDR